jgi:hypothetical protein
MLKKVISGCQTGSDRAGLIAAKTCGLETGGYVCTKNKTERGYEPELISVYNLTELNTFDYPMRTLANVNEADATWIFYRGKLEKGSALTEKYCKKLNKKYTAINIASEFFNRTWMVEDARDFIMLNNIKVLNIAGNRESVAPGIQQEVTELLMKVFKNVE